LLKRKSASFPAAKQKLFSEIAIFHDEDGKSSTKPATENGRFQQAGMQNINFRIRQSKPSGRTAALSRVYDGCTHEAAMASSGIDKRPPTKP
jgi:hypothetical protein